MNGASKWRIGLAEYLSRPYLDHESVKMLCLGGSAAKGISDEYSDLDIIVYWEDMDSAFIEGSPLEKDFGLRRTALLSQHPGTYLESYHIDGLKADFGHSTLKQWDEWVSPLIEDQDDEPALTTKESSPPSIFSRRVCMFARVRLIRVSARSMSVSGARMKKRPSPK